MTNHMADWLVDVPEGEVGDWRVERFTVDKDAAKLHRLQCLFSGAPGRGIVAGTYTRLVFGPGRGGTVMSDTPAECQDHIVPLIQTERRGGHVLIHGLGLGVLLQQVCLVKEVEHITVIERASEVIQLVGPHWQQRFPDRFEIIEADALTWKPPKGVRYSVVWHDIWNEICGDNLPEMHTLHRRYGRRCDWQGSWSRGFLEAQKRRRYYY